MRRIHHLAVLLALLAAALATGAGGAEPQPADVELELTPSQQAAGAATVARFRFSTPPDMYIQKPGFGVALLDAGEAGEGVQAEDVAYPPTGERYDEMLEETVEYWDGEFSVDLVLQIAPEVPRGDYELTFLADFQTCSPGICLISSERLTATLAVLPPEEAVEVALPAEAEQVPPEAVPPVESAETVTEAFAQHNALLAVLLAFVMGLGLTLTPCVYPLIPVTISLVGATSGRSRLDGLTRSLVYVLGISVTYSAAGVVAAATGGMFGAFLQHPAVYLVLAGLFVLLAGAMFGWYSFYFTSQRLQRLQGRLHGRAGLAGIFLAGLLSGAVATACIAPIVTAILFYVGHQGNLLVGFGMFFALAWGMGTPLIVLGTFTGLLEAMPKSGDWMVTVKHFFGLALLGVAVYFVGQSGLLARPTFLLLVAGFLLVISVFVGAFDRLTAETGAWLRVRKAAGLLLVAGAAGALLAAAGEGRFAALAPPHAAPTRQIEWVESEPEAVALAREQGRPLMLNFSARNCTACERMMRTTFRDPRVVGEAERFVMAKIDLSDQRDPEVRRMMGQYGIRGVPFILLRDTEGRDRTFTEYIGPDRMLELMQAVE